MNECCQSNSTAPSRRLSHAVGGADSRYRKALKIHRIINKYIYCEDFRILDIGAGTGHISKYFSDIGCLVYAVDRENNIDTDLGLDFQLIDGTELPFENGYFNVIIYNHVIEHVGDRSQQRAHLEEIARVLAPDGVLYLAVPNRWSLVEPHYKLPFLSWLPPGLASAYVRASGKHDWYDCRPLSRRELLDLMREAGFHVVDETEAALELYIALEASSNRVLKLAAKLPRFVRRLFMPIIPTWVMIGRQEQNIPDRQRVGR